jgi:hypothetical protein
MLDHVFTDAIGALRAALELAMLERQAVEERFTTDALIGDTRWDTSYSLPGESVPARVQADLSMQWPTWSQTAYRGWHLTGELSDVPDIELEVVFRLQGLVVPPDLNDVLDRLPEVSPGIGGGELERAGGPTVEISWDNDLLESQTAVEVSYAGAVPLHIDVLADGNRLDELLAVAGGWISSTLVSLSDL